MAKNNVFVLIRGHDGSLVISYGSVSKEILDNVRKGVDYLYAFGQKHEMVMSRYFIWGDNWAEVPYPDVPEEKKAVIKAFALMSELEYKED